MWEIFLLFLILRARLLKLGQWTKQRLRIKEATRGRLAGRLVSRNGMGKKWAEAGLLSAHWRVKRKGGPGDKSTGLAWDELPCPLLPWLQVSWSPLKVRRCALRGKKGGRGRCVGAPGTPTSFCYSSVGLSFAGHCNLEHQDFFFLSFPPFSFRSFEENIPLECLRDLNYG